MKTPWSGSRIQAKIPSAEVLYGPAAAAGGEGGGGEGGNSGNQVNDPGT